MWYENVGQSPSPLFCIFRTLNKLQVLWTTIYREIVRSCKMIRVDLYSHATLYVTIVCVLYTTGPEMYMGAYRYLHQPICMICSKVNMIYSCVFCIDRSWVWVPICHVRIMFKYKEISISRRHAECLHCPWQYGSGNRTICRADTSIETQCNYMVPRL